MIVKICGLVRPEDAVCAATLGADWLGLNFWPGSKRFVSLTLAQELAACAREIRPSIKLVGVFVDQPASEIADTVAAVMLDLIQLHGDEPPSLARTFGDRAIKAVDTKVASDPDRLAEYDCLLLLDTPTPGRGGSGIVGDWRAAQRLARQRPLVLAGGLTPENVGEAVTRVRPHGVDVASGVESAPGKKDPDLMRLFLDEVRAAEGRVGVPHS